MAYDPRRFSMVLDDLGGSALRLWAYATTDSADDVAADGYFTYISSSGAEDGDPLLIKIGADFFEGQLQINETTGHGTFIFDRGLDDISPMAFGAKGDGVNDDADAIILAISYSRAFSVAEAGWATTSKTLDLRNKRWRVTKSINLTGIREYNYTVDARGATIIGEVDGGIVVDALDSRFLTWIGGTITGSSDPARRPIAGLVIGRRSDNRVADTIVIRDLVIAGHFEVCSFANLQAETTHIYNSKFINFHPGFTSCCALVCGNGNHGLTSAYVTPTASAVSFNCSNFYGCDFKTFDSDGTTRGAGYPVRIVTDYTDGAAIRDIRFEEHYSNAIATPDAVQDTDYNVAIFYIDGYVHNFYAKGRSERRGYIDAVVRIKNTTNTARCRGFTVIEHYMAGRAGLIQAEGDDFPVFISQGYLSATVSQEAQLGSPLASPHGTLFGPDSVRSGNKVIQFTGHIDLPNDSLQNYRLNDLTGAAQVNGTVTTSTGYVNIVPPIAGSLQFITNSHQRFTGAKVFEDLNIFVGSPQYVTGQLIADDDVATWNIPSNSWVFLTSDVTTHRANFFASQTGYAHETAQSAGITYDTGVLTGTDGVDGDMTLSVDNGTIYVENRTGATRTVSVMLFGEAA